MKITRGAIEYKGHMPPPLRHIFPKTTHAHPGDAPANPNDLAGNGAQYEHHWLYKKGLVDMATTATDGANKQDAPIAHANEEEAPVRAENSRRQSAVASNSFAGLPGEMRGPEFRALIAELNQRRKILQADPLTHEQIKAIGDFLAADGNIPNQPVKSIEAKLKAQSTTSKTEDLFSRVDVAVLMGIDPVFKAANKLFEMGVVASSRKAGAETYLQRIAAGEGGAGEHWRAAMKKPEASTAKGKANANAEPSPPDTPTTKWERMCRLTQSGAAQQNEFLRLLDTAAMDGSRQDFEAVLDLFDRKLLDPNAIFRIGANWLARLNRLRRDGTPQQPSTAETVTPRERIHRLMQHGVYPADAAELHDILHMAIRDDDLELVNTLHDLNDPDELFSINLYAALHIYDDDGKIPAAYASSKEMVDALVALGVNKNDFTTSAQGVWIYPPYVHSINPEVAEAWVAYDPETDLGKLMGREQYEGTSVMQVRALKTPAIVDALCRPHGKCNPTEISTEVPYFDSVLHELGDGALAQAYVRQIRQWPDGEARLARILAHNGAEGNGTPLESAESYEVVETLLQAGAPVDRNVLQAFCVGKSALNFPRFDDARRLIVDAIAGRRPGLN